MVSVKIASPRFERTVILAQVRIFPALMVVSLDRSKGKDASNSNRILLKIAYVSMLFRIRFGLKIEELRFL